MKKLYIKPNVKTKIMIPQTILNVSFTSNGSSGTIDVVDGTGDGTALAKKNYNVWDNDGEEEQQ